MRAIAMFGSLFVVSCASTNMQVGQSQSYLSLADQRMAVQSVRLVDQAPPEAELIGQVEASRCHRNFLDNAPEADNVLIDLKVAAFAQGADLITNFKVDQNTGGALFKNCWHIKTGTADAYSLPDGVELPSEVKLMQDNAK